MRSFGLRERIAVGAVFASAAALLAVLLMVEPALRRRALRGSIGAATQQHRADGPEDGGRAA